MRKITLLILMAITTIIFSSVQAQNPIPGGAASTPGLELELWLSTDKLQGDVALPADGGPVSEWIGREGKYTFAQYLTHTVPKMKYAGMNFHPSITFEGRSGNTKLASTTNYEYAGTKYAYYTFWVSRMQNPNGGV